jgi:hypothetical protein
MHPGTRAGAQAPAAPVTFYGQVTSITGPADNPTRFTLLRQLSNGHTQVVPFRSPGVLLKPLSAEAEVEGFQIDDYALVTAHRVRAAWVASRVQFDTQPITPHPVITLSGTVTRVTPNGKRFAMRTSDTGAIKVISIVAKTQFRIDGQLVGSAPVLSKGDVVQVQARKAAGGVLVAVEINLKTAPTAGSLIRRLRASALRSRL